jgi:hypothetical protein
MSWGYRITFLYLGFVGIIITLVTISSQNKEELVAKDYYAQELLYQNKLNAINNEKQLDKSITHEVTDASIILTSPFEKSKGTIQFFCPSDSKNDKSYHSCRLSWLSRKSPLRRHVRSDRVSASSCSK